MRMKKRSNWFLGPNTTVSLESSRETSLGKSSLDATSSDALMSDVTASDGGISDTPVRRRCSSDVGSSFLEEQERLGMAVIDPHLLHTSHLTHLHHSPHTHHHHLHPPHQRSPRLQQPDIINGNHATGGTSMLSVDSPHHSLTPSPSPSDVDAAVTEKDVRYFMVENWYGKPASPSTPKSTS